MVYDKLIIYYYTGTGNALKASDWIIEEAKEKGLKTHLHSIDNNFCPDLNEITENTLIGFCYPTHGFNAVPAMLKFMFRFPNIPNPVFLSNTRAGMKLFNYNTPGISGIALLLPIIILFLKGFKIRGAYPLDMPSNWVSIHPGLNDKTIEFIYNVCEKKVTKFFSQIINGNTHFKRMLIDVPIDILLIPISIAYYFIGRFFLAKTLIYSQKCNSCQLCVKNCPVGAIKIINDKPFWTYKCESCMRCISYCPQSSIQASHLIFFIGILLFQIPFWEKISELFFGQFLFNNYWSVFFIDTIITMSLLYVIYFLIQRLLKYKWVETIFRYSSLTYYWRRYKIRNFKFSNLKKHE